MVLATKLDLNEYVSVMLPIVEGFFFFFFFLPGNLVKKRIFLFVLAGLQDDISWRVRKALSGKLPSIAKSVGESTASKRLLPLFAKLLKGECEEN